MATLENPRRERFCQEYVVDLNATQAATRAGYSRKTAKQQGSVLLTNPEVQARVAELQNEIGKRLRITQEGVVADLQALKLAAADAGNYGPAVKAAELQGKHIGMWPAKIDLGVTPSLADLVRKAHTK